MLLNARNLFDYVYGTVTVPSKLDVEADGNLIPNLAYSFWFQQDQIFLHGIIASTTESVVPFITLCKTSQEAWDKITRMYANKSMSMMMSLKYKLSTPKGSKSVNNYFQFLSCVADDLALINSPIFDDLVICAINGIGPEFKEIAVGVRARESEISFEELLDKIVDYECS